MRIDPKKVEGIYENLIKAPSVSVQSGKQVSKEQPAVKDRLELSSDFSKRDTVKNLKAGIADEIEKGASSEKLRSLKAAIKNGTYQVSSDDIAQAMLNLSDKN